MKINDILTEESPLGSSNPAKKMRTISILPGRFHPPHIGHLKGWQWLKSKFDETYIATSDIVDPPRSPFNFNEKKALFMEAGVPANNIIKTKSPYQALEIVSKFPSDSTIVIFGVSKKDMDGSPRFNFKPKNDGSPSFLQSYKDNMGNLEPLSEHAYIIVVPTFKFSVNGAPMKSATEFRANFAKANDSTQAKMISDLYGSYSDKIHNLMRDKIV